MEEAAAESGGLWLVAALSVSMFVGSYAAGYLPLFFTMSESRMRLVSIFGAGLLVGTALSVILPEGVESLYSAHSHHHNSHAVVREVPANQIHQQNAAAEAKDILNAQNGNAELPRIIPQDANLHKVLKSKRSAPFPTSFFPKAVHDVVKRSTNRVKRQEAVIAEQQIKEGDHHHEEEGHAHVDDNRAKIGYSLVLGFILMLIVDQIGRSSMSRNERANRSRIGISATVGLVVHAAADGIALGSASSINRPDIQFIVFLAIMLHKGPASFGLVSFLLMEGLDARTVKKHLLVFSSAAPLAALFTYVSLRNVGESLDKSGSSTGVLMLFSAGTFLYVATVHVLPELVLLLFNFF
ncbi:hypothetical protein WR25_08897 isoform B [Diploscapter pachys]|uniref:Zinc transporter ZIP9 n=1 Tax=Diploscapter pachys TaxID=2018661 RepID=A0A2A2JAV6_9BILA|nr:hypothetical protein WR25_08897 isoform B [Diploscapter pachys]